MIDLRRYKQREWNSAGGYDPISFAEGAPELSAFSATIEWRNRAFLNSPKQFSTKIMAGIPVEVDFKKDIFVGKADESKIKSDVKKGKVKTQKDKLKQLRRS